MLTQYIQLYYLLSEFLGILIGFNYLASTRYVWNKPDKKNKTDQFGSAYN
jgi:hypothetical protein